MSPEVLRSYEKSSLMRSVNTLLITPSRDFSLKIVSGGQSGVDRASLDVALALGIPCGGWCPHGRWAEDGEIPAHYPLTECADIDPALRTELNIRDSDATLVIGSGREIDGTALTIECARRYGRPLFIMDPQRWDPSEFHRWFARYRLRVLNIAGPRESTHPGSYAEAYRLLQSLFGELVEKTVMGESSC